MTKKMTVCAATAAVFGAFLSASAAGIAYDAELTNDWFAAGIPSLSTAGGAKVALSGPRWTVPESAEAYATNQLVMFDAEATAPLVYNPEGSSGDVALVNVRLFVEPNAAMPSTEGLADAQAALSVVTNTTGGGFEWVGLVKDSTTNKWVSLVGSTPVIGGEYDVQIALDNRTGRKKIRYAVKASGAGDYTFLTFDGESWLDNPKNLASVSAVAFAGTGKLGALSGSTVVNDAATIGVITDSRGYDFTNGTITAVVSIPSGVYTGKKAVLRVVDFATGAATSYEQVVSADGSFVWNLPSLTPGGTYSYTLSVKSGDDVRAVKSGTFVAANWASDCWFGAKVEGGTAVVTNGAWAATAPELNAASNRWDVSSDAVFAVTDTTPGSNRVTRVDTTYAFDSFIDSDSLEALDGAVGGLVAVSGGNWFAYTGAENLTAGWEQLSGGFAPAANTEYIVRAEFDFMSATHRVRYLVSSDAGATFSPLSLGVNEWINLANPTPSSLSSVGMSGKGYVKSICAKFADASVVQDSTGKRFATIWDAIKYGTGPFTLLHNATLRPSDVSSKQTFTIDKGLFNFIYDGTDASGWRLRQDGTTYYLMKPGATYIFF